MCRHNARLLCVSVYHLKYVLSVPSVSLSDGDKKKKQKAKGTLEPNLGLSTRLATLKVLSSQTMQVQDDSRHCFTKKKWCWQSLCSCTTKSWRPSLGLLMIGWARTSCSEGKPMRKRGRLMRDSSANLRWDNVECPLLVQPHGWQSNPLCASASLQGRFCLYKLNEEEDWDEATDTEYKVNRGIPPNGPVQVLIRVYIVSVRPHF